MTRFTIQVPPPPALTVAQTAAKYGLSKAAAEDVVRYVAGRQPVRRVRSRSRARKKVAVRKAR